MHDHHSEPTASERARTALAQARVGSLVTKGCAVRPATMTLVVVEDRPDGRPIIYLEVSSPTVRELGGCRVATLSVASAAPFRSLELTGRLAPIRSTRPGHRAYRLSPMTARLTGTTTHLLNLSDYQAAQPDPLADLAPAILRHLADAHAPELLSWVRAQGHRHAEAVLPRAVDRYGIDLAVIGADGVQRVRLNFPDGPIENPGQIRAGFPMVQACSCRDTDGRGTDRPRPPTLE